jgi:hypothetical protein
MITTQQKYVRRVSNAASASEGMRKKHQLQSLKRTASPATLEPLAILKGLPSPAKTRSVGSLFSNTSSFGGMEGSIHSNFNARYSASHNTPSKERLSEAKAPVTDNAELVALLTKKCNTLAERLGVLEAELAQSRANEGRGGIEGVQTASTSIKKASAERIDSTMVAMREKIGQLKDVFYTSVNEEATRESSVIRIQMHIRRCVVRRRFLNMRNAVLSWRLAHSQELVTVCHREIDRQRKISLKAASFKVMREMKMLQNVINVWEKEMRQGQALRRHIREAVGSMEGIMQHRWLKQVLRSWRGVCSGPSSKKACKSRYARRVEEARSRIQERLVKEQTDKGEPHAVAFLPTSIVNCQLFNHSFFFSFSMFRSFRAALLQKK